MHSLMKNDTWELVSKPEKQRVVDCKWIFKIKEGNSPGDKVRYKFRLVAKGFTQREGIDYIEIFSPVVKYKTIRMVLAMVVQFDWEIEQMDVKTAFLHGELVETIYMMQLEGYEEGRQGDLVCNLKKSLYGLK